MRRLGAILLAVVITAALFDMAFLGVGRLLGSHAFWGIATARWFPTFTVIFNGVAVSSVIALGTIYHTRGGRDAETEEKTLRSASERLQRKGPRF